MDKPWKQYATLNKSENQIYCMAALYEMSQIGKSIEKEKQSDFTFTFHFHALEKEMVTHSSVLAWRIPGTGEAGGLPSMGLHRVGHDWSDLAAVAAAAGARWNTSC